MVYQAAVPTRQTIIGEQGEAWRAFAPTERQIECLRAYVLTGSLKGAARSLGISSATVRNHLAVLRLRLGVHTSAQAVYSLMLGTADHESRCGEADHTDCVPILRPGPARATS